MKRISYRNSLKCFCHPKYYNYENFKYLSTLLMIFVWNRYPRLRDDMKKWVIQYGLNNCRPSDYYLKMEWPRRCVQLTLQFKKEMGLLTDEQIDLRTCIHDNLIRYIDKNLASKYTHVKDGQVKINYNEYYDDNYTKINLILRELINAEDLSGRILSLKYQIV
jgi:hypothetical protein